MQQTWLKGRLRVQQPLQAQTGPGTGSHLLPQAQGPLQQPLEGRVVQVGPGQRVLWTSRLLRGMPRSARGAEHVVEGDIWAGTSLYHIIAAGS